MYFLNSSRCSELDWTKNSLAKTGMAHFQANTQIPLPLSSNRVLYEVYAVKSIYIHTSEVFP